jgi:hypothetical protein
VNGEFAHRPRETTNLIGRFALGAQARKQCPCKSRVQVTGGELLHQVIRLPFLKIVPG